MTVFALIIGVIIGGLILALLIWLACIDGRFHIRRSRLMKADLKDCFETVVDFKRWPDWSPWLLHEPEAKITYSDGYREEGGYYEWDGDRVGAGKLTHISIKPGRSIVQQIEFLRPFKSSSEVAWDFESQENGTLVSWEMHGSMPFLFRFMAKRMAPMIERDYDLGLALLGACLNEGSPYPKISLEGPETLQAFNYRAIPCQGNLRQLESSRRISIETLRAADAKPIGLSLALFHDFDFESGHYNAELAVPVLDNAPASNYQTRQFDGGEYLKLSLQGELEFLPLAWHAAISHCRLYKIRIERKRPALEIYADDPGHAELKDRSGVTLYLPIKPA